MPPVYDKRKRALSPIGRSDVAHRDFLAEYAEKAGLSAAAVESVRLWLAQQFVADEFAKLEQGGHPEKRVALRRIFIDLPVSDQPIAMTTRAGARNPFMSILGPMEPVPFASNCNDAAPIEPSLFGDADSVSPNYGGMLLVGGPGQGKSTLGQLACQLHRAVLLRGKRALLTSDERSVLAPFEELAQAETPVEDRISLPVAPLLPLRIALPEFASWMADPKVHAGFEPALLRFLTARQSARSVNLRSATLEALCAVMPCLLVLDGFDEVGALEDRERIITAVRDLLTSLGEKNGRGLVLATTRPQGYSGELERMSITLMKKYMAHLSVEVALQYAKKVIAAKVSNPDEQEKFFGRLDEAAENDVTARLLRTPLQATILAALVQQGHAPQEQWQLFQKYFDITYGREIDRDSYASSLLRSHQSQIKDIHRRVALLLQVAAEQTGGAGARMSRERLHEVVDTVLAEDEVDAAVRAELAERILDAAEKRLVFLVEPEPGHFGFELQSLQEFMAAWLLSEGHDAGIIESRWLNVARAPLFRNVTIFMASRFFSERSAMRDLLAERICMHLNEEADPLTKVTKAGASLALEVLEEGSAFTQPKRARALMERAVALLDLPASHEHVRLAYATTEDTAGFLRSAIEMRFAQGAANPSVDTMGAWICLLALIDVLDLDKTQNEWILNLAFDWWSPVFHAPKILEACRVASLYVNYFVLLKIVEAPDLFDPYELVQSDIVDLSDWTNETWLRIVVEGFRRAPKKKSKSAAAAWLATPIPTHVHVPNEDVAEALRTVPTKWRPWIAAAQFHGSPSAKTLADALRTIAQHCASRADWTSLQKRVAWPLAACLNTADNPRDLVRFAEMADAGALGDIEQWPTLAQDRAMGPDLDQVTEGIPWTVESLKSAFPLMALRFNDMALYTVPQARVDTVFLHAKQTFARLTSPAQRAHVAGVCRALLPRVLHWRSVDITDVAPWFDAQHESPDKPVSARKTSTEEWLRALIRLAKHSKPTEAASPSQTIEAFLEEPANTHLLIRVLLVTAILSRASKTPLSNVPVNLRTRLEETLRRQVYTGKDARQFALVLRVWLGIAPADAATVVDEFAACSSESKNHWNMLILAVERGAASAAFKESLLLTLYARKDLGLEERARLVEAMREVLAHARRSGLDSAVTWNRFRLPLPLPVVPVSTLRATNIPEEPVVLRRLHVHQVRGIHEITLEFVPPEAKSGQWVVLLGPNGAGKTTLLRSLVLTLRNLEDPKIWPRGTFEVPWRRIGGSPNARVDVTVAGFGTYTTQIHANGSETYVQERKHDRPQLVPLFAYGCRRGSAFGGAQREVNLNDDDGPEVATLFYEGASLIHGETWLIGWDGDAAKKSSSRSIYDAIRGALKSILELDDIDVQDKQVWVTEKGKPRVPFGALSDGYLTMAGWVLDLIARWMVLAERYEWPIDEHFLGRMTGLVLIDEIDLFLHPKWQERVIDDVREVFPKMSFVVTTHNELTLRGARKGEIFVLGDHDNTGRITAIQRDIPKGTRIDQLITGEWFNRPSAIVDQDTRDLLEQHQRLLLDGVKAGDPGRKKLEEELRQRLGHFADTSLERLAATIVAQHLKNHLPEPFSEPSVGVREKVRDEVLAILAHRDSKQTANKRG